MRNAKRTTFTGDAARCSGIDGAVTAVAGAATSGVNSSAGPFFASPGEHTDVVIDGGGPLRSVSDKAVSPLAARRGRGRIMPQPAAQSICLS